MTTLVIGCKLRNGLNINGHIVKGFSRGPMDPLPPNSVGNYMLTDNFPAEAWDAWFAIMKDEPLITGRFVFAAQNMGEARNIARKFAYGR